MNAKWVNLIRRIQGRPQPRPACLSLPLAFRSCTPFIHSCLVSAPPAAQETQQAATALALRSSVSARGPKRLTRSERQSLARSKRKKNQEARAEPFLMFLLGQRSLSPTGRPVRPRLVEPWLLTQHGGILVRSVLLPLE